MAGRSVRGFLGFALERFADHEFIDALRSE
jgi:hypothetical protein